MVKKQDKLYFLFLTTTSNLSSYWTNDDHFKKFLFPVYFYFKTWKRSGKRDLKKKTKKNNNTRGHWSVLIPAKYVWVIQNLFCKRVSAMNAFKIIESLITSKK